MRALRRFLTRVANLVQGRRRRQRLEEEIREHLAQQTEEFVRAGLPPAEARRQAVLKFGPVEAVREHYHAETGLPLIEGLLQDVRYAARVLRKSRVFTLISAASLALAIGANTTIFSVAKQLLYERLAVPHPGELRLLAWTGTQNNVLQQDGIDGYEKLPGGLVSSREFSYAVFEQLRSHREAFADLFAIHVTGVNATVGDDTQRVLTHEVSGNYYAALGVRPQLGRALSPADDMAGSQPVAVISDEYWTSEFARSPSAIGRWIKLNDVPVMVVGVMPKGFTGAVSALPSQTPAVTVALAMQPVITPSSDGVSWPRNPTSWGANVMGRIRAGMSNSAAQAALDPEFAAAVRATLPVRAGADMPHLHVLDSSRGLFEQRDTFLEPMTVLTIFVGLVLLLACANIATLMLARGAEQRREMCVRLALGASRTRILRQLLVESLMLSLLGGAGGLVLGYAGRVALPRLTGSGWRPADIPMRFDWPVFAFTAAVTALAGIVSGLVPAIAAVRAPVSHGLQEGVQTATRRRRGPVGKAIVGFQVALSTLLVIVAGLFMRTLAGLKSVDPGFRTDHLIVVQVPVPQNRYPKGASIAFHHRLEQTIAAIPGVESATSATEPYLSDDYSDIDFYPVGELHDANRRQPEAYNAVGERFFETLGIPIVAGRSLEPGDDAVAPKVAVINQSLARTRFPNQNPIGKRFYTGRYGGHGEILTDETIEVVGVCGDTLYRNLQEKPLPQLFVPYAQQSQVRWMNYEVRTRMNPDAMLPALRSALRSADPELPLVNLRTQQEQIDQDLAEERLFVTLTSGFGLLALVLAAVGIYGVMAYSVAQRTNEIGIRMALGAVPRQVIALVLREASWLSAAGIAAGMGGSLALGRLLKSMLYGVAPCDPATFCAAALLLFAVGVGASWVPAHRAAKVEPVEALRRD